MAYFAMLVPEREAVDPRVGRTRAPTLDPNTAWAAKRELMRNGFDQLERPLNYYAQEHGEIGQ